MNTKISQVKLSKYPEPFRKAIEDCMIIQGATLIDVIEFSIGEVAGMKFNSTRYTAVLRDSTGSVFMIKSNKHVPVQIFHSNIYELKDILAILET